MMRSLASVPIAENMSANFATCSVDLVEAFCIFRCFQKYRQMSRGEQRRISAGEKQNTGRKSQVENLAGRKMVGPGGLEPLTSSVSRKRSNQLSYGPAVF